MSALLSCTRCDWFRKLRDGEKYLGHIDGSPAEACPECGSITSLLRT